MASCKVRVAYLNGSTELMAPPVELIQFVGTDIQSKGNKLNQISISELCFYASMFLMLIVYMKSCQIKV